MYRFFFLYPANTLHVFCFVLMFFFLHYFSLLCHFVVDFLFSPVFRCSSGTSLHFLMFPCICKRSDFFQYCLISFLGSPFWSSVSPFVTHLFISGFINFARFFCICMLSLMLETTSIPILEVSTHNFDT